MVIKLILLLILSTHKAFTHGLPITNTKSFSVNLIHRDSPKSPLYDPSSTFYNCRKSAMERYSHRLDHLQSAIKSSSAITPQTPESAVTSYIWRLAPRLGSSWPSWTRAAKSYGPSMKGNGLLCDMHLRGDAM
ncbi:hypothetical protein QJS10_CPB18g01752 [Acorus calamus]|uniref:Uncharacterized protein n=1 Tax=Acorus calamus TaxID=4465 RepID=A0AAV9CMF2_ACOCL|nr:hypothetical protein QJS10_CPB18g01752 [Acorus calamus]